MKLAQRIFNGQAASWELEDALTGAGVQFERLGWDDYANSIELHDVPPDHRLAPEALKVISKAGFAKVYVNHTDKWETHYNISSDEPSKGWRVSYPHKRDAGEGGIWVEEEVPTWPKDWFATGYAKVKRAVAALSKDREPDVPMDTPT